MQPLNHETLKHTYTTHAVPLAAMAGIVPPPRAPRIGDLVAAEVLSVGRHDKIEDRAGLTTHVFPGDRIVGAFGNRYATEQYEGYVPDGPVEECDLLSVGGVCGNVASRYAGFAVPSRLRVLGAVVDRDGGPLNQRAFGLAPRRERGGGEVVVVVGSAMSAGKTTTVGTLTRALRAAGWRVAAAKVTGTAAGKDVRFYASCGANPALDFTAAGYPSTYLLDGDELLTLYRTLLGHLRAANPDYVIIEIADGIFQRETRLLLANAAFRASVDHLFFAAVCDSLAAESGARHLRAHGLPLRAVAGAITQSPLMVREAEGVTGLPCLSVERILDGEALPLLQADRAPRRDNLMPLPWAAGLHAAAGAVPAVANG